MINNDFTFLNVKCLCIVYTLVRKHNLGIFHFLDSQRCHDLNDQIRMTILAKK